MRTEALLLAGAIALIVAGAWGLWPALLVALIVVGHLLIVARIADGDEP